MPSKKKDKDKPVPIPAPKPKGVLEIVIPAKNTEKKPTVNDYLKINAVYSEEKDNLMDEETKLIKSQIEQRLNEMLQVPYETKFTKTENESKIPEINHNKKIERSTDACISLFAKAVSQIAVVKKPEKETMLGVKAKPKRDILVPLERVKDKDEDYFKGTRSVKEKKVKPKKLTKVISFDSSPVTCNFTPSPPKEVQPIINRWQEKEGSKLFTAERDEEEEMLQLAIRESLKEARAKAEQQIQEELLYQELTRDAKKSKNEVRGNKLQNMIKNHSWDSTDGARGCDNFNSKIEEIKNIPVLNVDSTWDDELQCVKQEIDERQAKKERVKKSLKEKLKLLDNYGPLPAEEEERREKVVKGKMVKEEIKEKIKSVKRVGDEEVEELEFIDVDESDEEDKKKVPYDWSLPNKEVSTTAERQIQWNVVKKSEVVLEKKMKDLTFNDIKEDEGDEEFWNKTMQHLKTGTKPKLHQRDISKDLSVGFDIHALPPRNQRLPSGRRKSEAKSPEVNENIFEELSEETIPNDFDNLPPRNQTEHRNKGKQFEIKSAEVNENIFEEPSHKTLPKASLWNSTATSENRGFSKEYQTKRRETINKNTKPDPSKDDFELFVAKDIPDVVEEKAEGPFLNFEESDVPKSQLNDLNAEKNKVPEFDKSMLDKIDGPMVAYYLKKVLEENYQKQNNNQNYFNLLQMPNLQNNLQYSDLAQLNSSQLTTGLDFSGLLNSAQQTNLNLANFGLQQASNLNLPGIGSVQQTQIPNLQATDLNLLNVLNASQANGMKLPDLASIQQSQFSNQQQIPGLNLSNADFNNLKQQTCLNLLNLINSSGQQSQVPNMQQATNLNFPDAANVQQIPNVQQATSLNLPNVTSVQQSQIPNFEQARSFNMPNIANNLQQANDLCNGINVQEHQNASEEVQNPPVEQEPNSDENLKVEKLINKIKNLQEQLDKEVKEKQQLLEQTMQNQVELVCEEQVEEELPTQEELLNEAMGPMMPNPYLSPPVMYPNQMPMYYPIIPPASHLPPPPWGAPAPYMGPMVYRQPYYLQRPQ